MSVLIHNLSPEKLNERALDPSVVLVPVGTVEWHADHLPLGVDGHISSALCEAIAAETGCVVAPPQWYGVCRDLDPTGGYYGTIDTIGEETQARLVENVLQGLARLGFADVLLFSGHFETEHHRSILRGIDAVAGITAAFITAHDLIGGDVQATPSMEDTWEFAGDHAAEYETSLMLAIAPHLVAMEQAPETIELTMEGIPPYLHRRFPRRASAEYGERLKKRIVQAGAAYIRQRISAR